MGDRICIRITNGEEVSPTFYGHWCGIRGLKTMTEAVREPYSTMGNLMCNFIVKIMEGQPKKDSYEIWASDVGDYAANGDWWLWTYHCHLGTWTTTHPLYNDRSMTNDEVEALVKSIRPCLYRTCPCDNYGGDRCFAYFLDMTSKMRKIQERERKRPESL